MSANMEERVNILEENTLRDIITAIWDARAKWRDIGLKLGLTRGDIDAIHEHDDGENLREVVKQWLRSGEATVHQLFRGLRDIERLDLVNEMRSDEKYRAFPGLDGQESFDYLELTFLEEMEHKLSGKLDMDDLYSIPITNWYKLGLYLGIQESKLHKIKEVDDLEESLSDLPELSDSISSNNCQSDLDEIDNTNEIELSDNFSNNGLVDSDEIKSANEIDETEVPLRQQHLMFEHFVDVNEKEIEDFISTLKGQKKKDAAKFLLIGSKTYEIYRCKKFISSLETCEEKVRKKFVQFVQQMWLKPVQLVIGFVRVGHKEIADSICKNKGVSLTSFLEAVDPGLNPPKYIVEYSRLLKQCYIKHFTSLQDDDDWPPKDTKRQAYSNLAIIKGEQIHKSKPCDYVHGNIDSIIGVKEPIKIDQIVLPICNEHTTLSNFTVLLEGAPGVGKTTVLKKICLDWANGKLLQEYKVVIFYSLRDVEQNDLDLVSLLHPPVSKAKKVAEFLEEVNISGRYCLFLLDGFDELSDKNRSKKSSIVNQIITGKILGNCSVVVSSRPYASSRLRRQPMINRHVEVLGFTREQIVQHISKSISECDSKALIQALDDRLDILSLCYIPLNCNIVLFVYKQKGNQLPTTLTDLYDTFILHTIKRSAIKQQSLESVVELIEEVDEINELPECVLKRLNLLCKVAFCCLEKDQLSVSTKELTSDVDGLLSLGLLSSLQFMNERSIVKRYQFLHLTIQEFLAAKYLALQHIDQFNFFASSVNKVRFRLTFMFLAGLTHLDFLPSGYYLLENVVFIKKTKFKLLLEYQRSSKSERYRNYSDSENDEYWEPELVDTERIEQWNNFLLHAQMFFESQRTSFDNLFSFQSDSFEIDGLTLSKFDSVIIAHLLSCIPDNFVWRKIDLTYSNTTANSLIFKKHLCSSNHSEVCLKKTHQLLLDDVPFSYILSVLDQNVWLTSLQFNCDKLNHRNFCNLCAVIAENKYLERICINKHTYKMTIVSKQVITINITNEMCSASLLLLSKFLDGQSLEHFNIAFNEYIFDDCILCGSKGIEAVKVFGKSIGKSLQSINLNNCKVSLEIINALVSVLSTTNLKELNVNGNDFNSGYGALPQLFSRGTVIIIHNLKFQPVNGQEIVIEDLDDYTYDTSVNQLLDEFILPQEFTKLKFDYLSFEVQPLSLSKFLQQNLQLTCVEFTNHRFDSYNQCSDLAQLVEVVIHHPSIKCFCGFHLEFNKNNLSYSFGCAKIAVTLLMHVDYAQLNTIAITTCGCSSLCGSSSSFVSEKLCEILVMCTALKKLDLTDCNLSEASISSILEVVSTYNLDTIDHIILNGNCIGCKNLSKLLSLMKASFQIKVKVYGLSLKMENRHFRVFQFDHKSEVNNFLCSLQLPCDSKRIEFVSDKYEVLDAICFNTMISFLLINSSIMYIKFNHVEKLSCNQCYKLSQSILYHPMLEEISFKLGTSDVLISRSCLQWKKGICSSTLNNLCKFLKSENLEIVDISQNKNLIRCSDCNDDVGDIAFTNFLNLIINCKCLIDLDMSLCFLPCEQTARLLCHLKQCKSLKNLKLSGNEISGESIGKLSTIIVFGNLEEFVSSEFVVYVRNRPSLSMEIMLKNSIDFQIGSIFQAFEFENNPIQLKKLSIKSELSYLNSMDKCMSTTKVYMNTSNYTLEQLHLTRVFLDIPQLTTIETCYLQDLILVSASLNSSTVMMLLNKLNGNKILKTLSIAHNFLIDLHVELGEAFQYFLQNNKCLENLNLSNCHLSIGVFEHIACGLSHNRTMKTLDISRHEFQNGQFVKQILKENKSIQILKMPFCILDEIVYIHIGEGLSVNSTLKEIYLGQSNNSIRLQYMSDDGWAFLFNSLQRNTTLQLIDIGVVLLDTNAREALDKLMKMKSSLKMLSKPLVIIL